MSERTQRRLAAILAADVVGYSKLMGEDEARTLEALAELRGKLFEPVVAGRGGIVIKRMGDGWIVEFPNIYDAVASAIEVQEGLSDHGIIRLRIGVHIGDVTFRDGDVYGDGINVVARLEAIAEPGQVLISDTAYQSLDGKSAEKFAGGEQQELKNIARPVAVWRWPAGSAAMMPEDLSLPDKPSIAVLPFDNMSGDPDQDYFADGISEDILTALARFSSLFVIARNSSFAYKGKSIDIKQVGQELGVRYVLEGSVRKAGTQVRITGQLIEAASGGHVWADRYDGDLEDVFALQDFVSESVVGALVPSIERAEIDRAQRKPTDSLDAYDLYLRALPHFYAMSQSEDETAMALLRRAIVHDPKFATAKYLLANCLTWGVAQGWFSMDEVKGEALTLAKDAVRLDNESAEALAFLARLTAYFDGRHADAIDLAEQAVTRNANSFMAWSMSGWVHSYAGDATTAKLHFDRAFRLSPRDPMDFDASSGLAITLLQLGQDDQAINAARRSTQRNPNFSTAWRILAAALAQKGDSEEAAKASQRLLQLEPGFTIGALETRPSYTDQARSRYIEGLRKAGLPE